MSENDSMLPHIAYTFQQQQHKNKNILSTYTCHKGQTYPNLILFWHRGQTYPNLSSFWHTLIQYLWSIYCWLHSLILKFFMRYACQQLCQIFFITANRRQELAAYCGFSFYINHFEFDMYSHCFGCFVFSQSWLHARC